MPSDVEVVAHDPAVAAGAVGVVRVGTSFARQIQTGYLRAYALLLVMGVVGLGLYFLLVST